MYSTTTCLVTQTEVKVLDEDVVRVPATDITSDGSGHGTYIISELIIHLLGVRL